MTLRSDMHAAHDEQFHGVREMMRTLGRVISLQAQIIALQVKNTLKNICIAAALICVALALAIVAVIFFDIGFFYLLTDICGLRTIWAALIFSGVHLVAAVLLGLTAKRYISKTFSNSQGGSHAK